MAPESDQYVIAALKQAEQALTGEKEFSHCLLESMADGVVACDANGILTLFNRSARDWHGMDPLRLPPSEWSQHYDLFRADGITPLPTDEIPLARAFRGESVRDAGMAIKTKGHPIRFILANGSVILDEAGKKLGAVVIMRDVTEFRRLELELRKSNEELEKRVEERTEELRQINRQLHLREHEFRTLANSLPDNIVRYDRQGRTVYVNPVLEKTLGAAAADMIGKRVREINPDGSYEAYAQALDAALASGGNGEIELTLFIPSEEPLVHQIRMIAEHDDHGEVTGVLAIGHDITERKRAEEELHLKAVELEQEVAERQMAQENLQEKALLLEEEIEKRQNAQDALEKLNEKLEQRVKQRTNELEEKNKELYKMNRIFVGRELRMVELKKRIRELENAGN